jgi:hypothetical protein
MKARGIKPTVVFDWTGKKHPRQSPTIGKKRPECIGHIISEAKKGHLVSEDTRKKISNSLKGRFAGENSPVWIKDRTKVKVADDRRNDSNYKLWRKEVYKRDGWKCKVGNCECKGKIVAHHILPWRSNPELRYQANNGITLCHAHHPIKRAEEKRLEGYFKKLISQ